MILSLNHRVTNKGAISMDTTPVAKTNDPAEAAAILAGLQEKKEAGEFCLYPGCRNPRQAPTGKSGRRRGYCALEEHNISTAFQERQRLKSLVDGAAQESSEPAGKSSPTTLKDSVIGHMLRLLHCPYGLFSSFLRCPRDRRARIPGSARNC